MEPAGHDEHALFEVSWTQRGGGKDDIPVQKNQILRADN